MLTALAVAHRRRAFFAMAARTMRMMPLGLPEAHASDYEIDKAHRTLLGKLATKKVLDDVGED